MKKLEKWLAKPAVQRFVYLLLLILCFYLLNSNGTLRRVTTFSMAEVPSMAVVLGLVSVLGAQLIWNRKWLWMILCAMIIGFTLWLATLSLSQLIAGAGAPAKTVVWAVGVIGFTIVLVLVLAFINWMLLHMKPKK